MRQRSRREANGDGPKESLTHSNHKMGTSCPPSLVSGGGEGTNDHHAFKALIRTVKHSSLTDSWELTQALSGYPPQSGSDEGGETREQANTERFLLKTAQISEMEAPRD